MIHDAQLEQKINEAAAKIKTEMVEDEMEQEGSRRRGTKNREDNRSQTTNAMNNTAATVAQVVGIIIGSPEFQRK